MATSRTVLSIYKLKTALASSFPKSVDGIIDADRKTTVVAVDIHDPDADAQLFVAKETAHLPSWAEFLRPAVTNIGSLLHRNAANSAVMIVAIDKRLYAIAFGYGRHLIDDEAIERGFGLRSALSILDPDRIRHVGYKEIEARTLFGDLQTSQATQFYNFSLNPDAQMLRGVQGGVLVSHDKWATHALGTDALQVNPMMNVDELPRLLRWVTGVDNGKVYQQTFAWVDHVLQVADRAQVAKLREALPKYLKKGGTGVSLGTPEPVDAKAGATYRLGRSAPSGSASAELSTALLKAASFDVGSYDELAKHRVFVENPNGDIMHRWSVWRCLSGEFKDGGIRYVVQDGQFFSIEAAFETRVDTRLAKSAATTARCPVWSTKTHPTEGDYNLKVLLPAVAKGSACLDKKCVTTYRFHAQIEVCDVFEHVAPATTMFFVKKYSGSSSPLSHLVAQASVSAEALRDDPDFRMDASGKWSIVSSALAGTFNPATVEIRICIAVKKRKLADLPFFAKLTLAGRADRIRSLGYGLAIELFGYT